MRDLLAGIGAIFLLIMLWMAVDYNSFLKVQDSVHRAIFNRQLTNQVQLESSPSPSPASYQLNPTATPNPLLNVK